MLARGVGEGFRHFGLVCRQTGPTDLIRLGRRKPRGREVRLIWIKSADREWRVRFSAACRPPNESAPLRTLRQLLSGEDIVQLAIRLGLLALLIYWTLVLLRPFLPILAWSVVLAAAFYPVFRWLAKFLGGRPKLAATTLTIINLGILIGPATWLGLSAVEGVREFAGQLSAGELAVPSPPGSIKDWPLVGPQLFELWNQASNNLRAALRDVAAQLQTLAGTMLALAGNAGVGTHKFLLSVALAGFLFLHVARLAPAFRDFLYRIVPEQNENFL